MKVEKGTARTVNKIQTAVRWLSAIWNLLSMAVLIGLLLLNICVMQSKLGAGIPRLAGYQLYIVSSGSMSPTFDTGSVVVVRPKPIAEIAVGDIITYRHPATGEPTTHRVVEITHGEPLSFTTKGDANENVDVLPVPATNVLGRVVFSIPYAGYVVNFAQTTMGLVLLFILPGLLVIALEARNLISYVRERDEPDTDVGNRSAETSRLLERK